MEQGQNKKEEICADEAAPLVRPAQKEDLELLAELAMQLWGNHIKEELLEEFSDIMKVEDAVFFLVCKNERPVGFAQCQLRHDYVEGTSSSPVGYLEGIFIKEEYQKRGYARILLTECEAWALSRGCKEFASDCELENQESFAFHLQTGFSEANRIICFTKEL